MSKNAVLKDALLQEIPKSEDVYYTTGSTLLDLVLGGAPGVMGIRGGVLTNAVGDAGAGKSFLFAETIAHNARKLPKFTWNYADCERRFRFDTMGLHGVQISDITVEPPKTIEELDANIGNWCKNTKGPGMYVVDSLDSLSNEDTEKRSEIRMGLEEKGKDVTNAGTFGASTPKFLSQEFFRTKMAPISKSKAALVFLSQVRENIGAGLYGKKLKRTGGKALEHWCDNVIWLKTIQKIKVGDKAKGTERTIGVVVEAETTKNSTGRPYRSCRYSLYFDYGIDNIGSNLDYLYDLRGLDGKLLGAANAINWDNKATKTLTSLKQFAESHELLDAHKDWLKETQGNRTIRLDLLDQWLAAHAEHGTEYVDLFASATLSRDDLISKIENDPALEKELERRVIEKWEGIEDAARTNRRPKFS